MGVDIHSAVLERHKSDDQSIHGQRNHHDLDVELHKFIVLGQSLWNKAGLHDSNKVPVQRRINEQDDDLLYPVPDCVDSNISTILLVRTNNWHFHWCNWCGSNYLSDTCNFAGIQIQNTVMLTNVTANAVPHLIRAAFFLFDITMDTRLMMICMSSCSSNTHSESNINAYGKLYARHS